MSLFSALVWTIRDTPDDLTSMLDRLYRIMDDHDAFSAQRPKWFAN